MGSAVRLDDIISYLRPNYRALKGFSLGLIHLRKHRCIQRFSSILPFLVSIALVCRVQHSMYSNLDRKPSG